MKSRQHYDGAGGAGRVLAVELSGPPQDGVFSGPPQDGVAYGVPTAKGLPQLFNVKQQNPSTQPPPQQKPSGGLEGCLAALCCCCCF